MNLCFRMYIFRRILSILLLGDLIAGVNQETSNSEANEYSLSIETIKILNCHHKIAPNLELKSLNDGVDATSLTRRKRSVTSSLCSNHDSCVRRCGKLAVDLPYTCSCDSLCKHFSDCCIDYDQQCKANPDDILHSHQLANIPQLRCEILFLNFNLLIVNQCPAGYADLHVKKLCASKLPRDCHFEDDFNENDSALVLGECMKSVHRSCISKMKSQCNVNIEPQCMSAITKKCAKFTFSKCQKCNKNFWPVYGENGIVYRNSFCAMCNSQKHRIILSPYDLKVKMKEIDSFSKSEENVSYLARSCIPVNVDTCPNLEEYHEMEELCHNYSGAVVGGGKKGLIYKNLHCAICNGEESKNLECVTKVTLMRGLIRPLLETFVTGDVQGMKLDDIPAAFSILLNFGLDGRERMYFSSENEEEMKRQQEKCGKGKIWDPFSGVCRKLYCSTEFILVDYTCVRKENFEEDIILRNDTTLPDARADFVHLSLSAEVEMLDFLQFYNQDIDKISEKIRHSLATSFNININRIRDVRFNISLGDFSGLNETLRFLEEMHDLHPISFKIDFDLYEDYAANVTTSEPSVDSIVSMLASSLSMNGFEFDINNVTSRIFEIHQTVSPLTSWCNSKSGIKKEYWNSEFSLIINENSSSPRDTQIKGIYVNKTGKFYLQGSFVADILFQGYQFSGNLINVSGVAIVCEPKSKLNESCIRILIQSDEYSVLENGSLFINNMSLRNVIDHTAYDVAENDSLWVCVKSLKTVSYELFPMNMDVVQAWVSYVLLWISVVAMVIVMITYIAFGSLRNLPGCNTMNLTLSLIAMQITFLFGQRSSVTGTACAVVGHLLHYEILCSFMWMNVMAFDLFRTFGNRNHLSNIRSKTKYLPLYMIYAYLSPAVIILIASLLDIYLNESSFAPHYGKNNLCWIASQESAIVFFAVPLAFIMLINFIFFLLTMLAMKSVKSMSQMKDLQSNRKGKSDVFLYARMALVIGLTWALSFAAAFVSQDQLAGKILRYMFIIFNTLQGLFIFWAFVCNKRVYEMYKEVFWKVIRKASGHAKYESSSGTLTRLKDAMQRSVSTNTVVSTLSNASASSNDSQLPIVPE